MKYTISMLFCLITMAAIAQNKQALFLGPGFGMDHGGIGLKAEYQPAKHIGLFGGIGYNLADLGANGGIIVNILPNKKITPVLTAMYGYNAVLKIEYPGGMKDYAVYNGVTFGPGVDFKFGRNSTKHKINVNLLFPIRNSTFKRDYDYLEQNGEIYQRAYPVAISFGWNYNIFYSARKN